METFVVRVWSEEEGVAEGLRGLIRHVRTGREIRFSEAIELVDLLTNGFPPEPSPDSLSPPGPAPR